MLTRGFLVLGMTLLLSFAAMAQSDAASGELHGSVTDPSGAVVPGAKVTVKSDMTGLARAAETNEQGEYRILLLPPGVYDVQVEKAGFRTQVLRDVRVTVGQIAILDVHLELGSATYVVEVSAQPALVESQRSHQANTLEEQSVHSLPIDRRDYLSFTLLAPGVVDSSALADNADFRVTQTNDSGLSFYGSNGRGNSITIDGGEANDAAGGVRPTLSQEAVQEFQINRSNYSAELGGASGGVINIVSKAGANKVRGTAFAFFRTDKLDAADPFAKALRDGHLSRIKPPADRQQFGASLGLPIRKDKTFLLCGMRGYISGGNRRPISMMTPINLVNPVILSELLGATLVVPSAFATAFFAGAPRAALRPPPSDCA